MNPIIQSNRHPRCVSVVLLCAALAVVTLMAVSCTGSGKGSHMDVDNGTVTEGTPSHDMTPETAMH